MMSEKLLTHQIITTYLINKRLEFITIWYEESFWHVTLSQCLQKEQQYEFTIIQGCTYILHEINFFTCTQEQLFFSCELISFLVTDWLQKRKKNSIMNWNKNYSFLNTNRTASFELQQIDFRKAFDTSNLFYILTLRQVWIYNVHKTIRLKKSILHITFFLLKKFEFY